MAFQLLHENVREALRKVTRAGTPAGLQLLLNFRELPVDVDVEVFFATLRKTVTLKEDDECLLHAFLDPFESGKIAWRLFVEWVRRPINTNPEATEQRICKTLDVSLRVCAALRKKLFLTKDGDYDFAATFRRMAQSMGSAHDGNRQDEHFVSYFDVVRYVRRCIKITPKDARYLLAQIDADMDGEVSLKDFTGFMLRHLQPPGEPELD